MSRILQTAGKPSSYIPGTECRLPCLPVWILGMLKDEAVTSHTGSHVDACSHSAARDGAIWTDYFYVWIRPSLATSGACVITRFYFRPIICWEMKRLCYRFRSLREGFLSRPLSQNDVDFVLIGSNMLYGLQHLAASLNMFLLWHSKAEAAILVIDKKVLVIDFHIDRLQTGGHDYKLEDPKIASPVHCSLQWAYFKPFSTPFLPTQWEAKRCHFSHYQNLG